MVTDFRDDFNYYKKKEASLKEVLDFNDHNSIKHKVSKVNVCPNCPSLPLFGLIHPNEWEIYRLISNPGLIFIKNPFTAIGQRYWIIRCLRDYPKKPSRTNLDIHSITVKDDEWLPLSNDNITSIVNKLRWATVGYHHNWDTKVYSEDSKSDFPEDLKLLSRYISNVLQFDYFNAEAAIVNFYHMNSRLSGHTDHSEQCLDSPLFSVSFGQSAIFLLGGLTTDVKPAAMFLNSGDIVVMSKESRLSYHGVPKIISNPVSPWSDVASCNSTDNSGAFENEIISNCQSNYWTPFEMYININRININVRQVLKRNQEKIYS